MLKTIADLHCDTISRLFACRIPACRHAGQSEETLAHNTGHLDIGKMRAGGYSLQVFALFADTDRQPDPCAYGKQMLTFFQEEMKQNSGQIAQVRSYAEWKENERQGKLSALLSIEEGALCGGKISVLREFYQAGVRMMTLTWNHPNVLGVPHCYEPDSPLTPIGRMFVEEMESLGMLIDVSHLSDRGFEDVAQLTRRPFLASHSNARAVCGHSRNLTDAMIKKLAERGGIIGVNFYPPFLEDHADTMHAEALIAHIRHLIQAGGEECVALGSDFDGMSGRLLIEDASQMQKLPGVLKTAFSEEQIDRLLYKNAERFFRDTL